MFYGWCHFKVERAKHAWATHCYTTCFPAVTHTSAVTACKEICNVGFLFLHKWKFHGVANNKTGLKSCVYSRTLTYNTVRICIGLCKLPAVSRTAAWSCNRWWLVFRTPEDWIVSWNRINIHITAVLWCMNHNNQTWRGRQADIFFTPNVTYMLSLYSVKGHAMMTVVWIIGRVLPVFQWSQSSYNYL